MTNQDIPAQVINSQFLEKIASGQTQKAAEAATDFTRLTLREEGLLRKVLPPQTITSADLDKQVDTDKPVKIVDKEVNQPLSASVPFGTLPKNWYMRGNRYRIDFARLVTRNYTKDVRELEQYDYDLREVFKENAIKDMMTAEDVPFFRTVDQIVSSNADPLAAVGNQPSILTGKVQYYDFTNASYNPAGSAAGFTRSNVVESMKILTKGYGSGAQQTPIRLHTETVVMNVNTGLEFAKLDRNTAGGDLSQELFKGGLIVKEWLGRKFIFTIKDDVVADGVAYLFAAPQFVGKFYELDAPTMFIDKRAFMLEFFSYSSIGCSVGNPYAVAKVKFF
jgi:hypothetical protein